MTKLFLLPADLAALNDPDRLAGDLRGGSVRLDWSRVTAPNVVTLSILFADLDRERDAAALALDTLPHALRPIVDSVLATVALQRSLLPEPAPEVEPVEPEQPALEPVSAERVRDELVELALSDLHGPAQGEDEVLIGEDTPDERYLLGALAPEGVSLSGTESDLDLEATVELDAVSTSAATGNEDERANPGPAAGRWLRPRSLGLTFAVDASVTEIVARVRWGGYRRISAEEAGVELPEDVTSRRVWQRTQAAPEPVTIPLDQPTWKQELFDADGTGDVYITAKSRKRNGAEAEDRWLVTLFLVNKRTEPKQNKAEAWLFQASLTVEGVDGAPVFLARSSRTHDELKPEESQLEMVYRDRREFAVGHGIAVHATGAAGIPDRARRLETTATPHYEVPAIDIPRIAGLQLDMRELAKLDGAELTAALRPLADAYRVWIAGKRASIETDATLADHRDSAELTLEQCDAALARIEAGIALLESDEQAARAFRFMQAAMANQRVHSSWAKARREGKPDPFEAFDVPKERSWRPFQLAFILINLPSLTRLDHPERAADSSALADLLWFPTGGGKTEAYLGLTAYTLAIRRLQGEIAGRTGDYGVAVLMRYTLRLLTLQQFQRAAALICACELLRAKEPATWGDEPFRLGLWVGRASTPNTTNQAKEALDREYGAGSGTPAQLTSCPWCGSEIDPRRQVRVDADRGRTLIFCGDRSRSCPFSEPNRPVEGLPVVVVDEEIYRLLPALVIATVDKFARVPWVGATRNLFGMVERRCERHGFWAPDIDETQTHRAKGKLPAAKSHPVLPARPIDLIIQDELHLISGPLGSMVGLYETAIDGLLSWTVDGVEVRPKVVASTATIRRARDQVNALFTRDVAVFPPSGLDITDSFFSEEASLEERRGRLYVGVCVPGLRHKAVLIRVYVALMASAQTLREKYGAAKVDPYLTLLGYFGSIRELGGMVRVVEDDVRQRLQRMDRRGFSKRLIERVQELTSRLSSAEIPNVLAHLERPFIDVKQSVRNAPYDVVLATNMISVGVDVTRLGLMVVAGQPKATAEYIQATSRVGRSDTLGLVFVVYHGNRPRDLSHYERFEHDHATFYRQVEPLSVTPFSEGAIERGLASVLVTLVRHGAADLAPNKGAAMVTRQRPEITGLESRMRRRAGVIGVDNHLTEQMAIRLRSKIDEWIAKAELSGPATLGYEESNDGRTLGLLQVPDGKGWKTFTAPMSMRNVEPSVPLLLRGSRSHHEEVDG